MKDKYLPLSVPNFVGNELSYVSDAVETEWVSSGGAYVTRFEDEFAEYLGVDAAVACQSGTAGLHLAYQLSGVTANDEVIVPTLTFIATVNPIRYLNANPVFMDCDDSLNIDLDKLKKFLSEECEKMEEGLLNKSSGNIIKALVIVHVFGNVADMVSVMEIAKQYNLMVIEDATESLGAYIEVDGKKRCSGTFGHFGIFSFNGNKIITSGGGGMLISSDCDLLNRAKYLSTQAKDDDVYFIHNSVGYNYRMTNLQAALGLAQLESIDKLISIKEKNYLEYKEKIKIIKGLHMFEFNNFSQSNYWFYSLVIEGENAQSKRDELLKFLQENGVQTRPVWGLIHRQLPYVIFQRYNLEKSLDYSNRILNLPCSTNLTSKDIDRVISLIKEWSE